MSVDNEDVIRYKTLSELSKSKRSNKETEEMYRLESKIEDKQKEKFQEEVDNALTEVYNDLKPPGEFNYSLREKQAEELADLELPPAEQITPDRAVQFREQLNAVMIQADSLASRARRRCTILESELERLEAIWRNRTIQDSHWRADAGAADILADLRKDVGRAKAHAQFCEQCASTVQQTNYNLRWIMEDKDRDVNTKPKL